MAQEKKCLNLHLSGSYPSRITAYSFFLQVKELREFISTKGKKELLSRHYFHMDFPLQYSLGNIAVSFAGALFTCPCAYPCSQALFDEWRDTHFPAR